MPKVATLGHGGAECRPSSLHGDAGRLGPTTQPSLTPKSLRTLAVSPASSLTAYPLPPAKIEGPSSPPLQSQCPSPPFKSPLLSPRHAPPRAGPTYISTSSGSLPHPHLQNPLLRGPTRGPTHHPQTWCHVVQRKPVHVPSLKQSPPSLLLQSPPRCPPGGEQVWRWNRRRDSSSCQAQGTLGGGAAGKRGKNSCR